MPSRRTFHENLDAAYKISCSVELASPSINGYALVGDYDTPIWSVRHLGTTDFNSIPATATKPRDVLRIVYAPQDPTHAMTDGQMGGAHIEAVQISAMEAAALIRARVLGATLLSHRGGDQLFAFLGNGPRPASTRRYVAQLKKHFGVAVINDAFLENVRA